MKIGLLSDIHGHIDALKNALQLLDDFGIETILCAGDLVEDAGSGDAVVHLLQERNIPVVQGNHDTVAISLADSASQHPWLQADTVRFLIMQPISRILTLHNRKILLAHGTPWDNTSYLYPEDYPSIRRLIEETDAEITVLGHTHAPMHLQIGDRHILNAGSVYRNRFTVKKKSCAIFDLETLNFRVYNLYTRDVLEPEKYIFSSIDKVPHKRPWQI